MEALILSCGTGGGHNSAARAIQEELERRGHRAVLMNPYSLQGGKLSGRIDGAYIGVAQKAPPLFGTIYAAGNLYRRLPCRSPVYHINGLMAQAMDAFLKENHFDVILMPHIFPAEILTYMRLHGMAVPKTILIATDYTCIPFAEECLCDAYITPAAALTEEFVARGIPKEQLCPFGIPVRRDFRTDMTRQEAKALLGLEEDKRYILISGGSIGAGKVEKALSILHAVAQADDGIRLIAVCGNNLSLYHKLQQRLSGSIRLIAQTNQMAAYLRACDLYLTKPGGLSTTEAAVMGAPLGLLPPIPGCETHNLRFFESNGMGRAVQATEHGLRQILTLMEDPEARAVMSARQREVIPADAADRICDLAERMAARE